jgi:predicted permease
MRAFVSAFESVIQDVRYGARLLRQSPWFACVGVGSLAMGLGGGIALFTALNAVLFRPLPGRGTDDLYAVYTSNRGGGRYGSSSFADFRSFTSAAPQLFAGSCATTNAKGNLSVEGRVQPLAGAVVNGGCLDALGIRPHLGRLLNASDDSDLRGSAAIVISYTLWRRAFGADPSIVGREGLLNGASVVVAGVAEEGFAGISLDGGAEFWAPAQLAPILISPRVLLARTERRFRVYARFNDGVTAQQAAERLSIVAAQLRAEDPEAWTETSGATRTITVVPELDGRFASSQGAPEFIAASGLGAIAAVVAMACVNLATMFMARGAARRHELNVRLALGASRARLLRQLATESVLISVAGAAAGAVVVAAGLRIYDAYRPAEMPSFSVALDWRVAVFSIAIAMLAPVLFGLAPGAHALRLAIAEGLKGRPSIVRRGYLRLGSRELLLVTQIAASFALLIAAGLFTRSLVSSTAGTQGGATRLVAVVPVDLNTAARPDASARENVDRLLQAANRVPNVEASTLAALVPMTGSYVTVLGLAEDRPDATPVTMDANIVAPGYFDLLGIASRAGRTFDQRDRERAPLVAIVSESLARRLWDTPAAVGRTIHIDDVPREVIGVVADVPYRSLTDAAHPVVYLPFAQAPRDRIVLHARVKNEGEAIAALGRALRSVDPRIIVGSAISMRQQIEQTKIGGRVAQAVGSVAGLLQLGLALMATWGLVAYAVERRTAEIAIRRALGATEASILQLVMRPSLWLLAIGGPIGCAAGVLSAKALHAEFLGLAPFDATIVAPAVAVLVPVVVCAAWLPARRAIAIEPASALKQM